MASDALPLWIEKLKIHNIEIHEMTATEALGYICKQLQENGEHEQAKFVSKTITTRTLARKLAEQSEAGDYSFTKEDLGRKGRIISLLWGNEKDISEEAIGDELI